MTIINYLKAQVTRNLAKVTIIGLAGILASCAPDNSFRGSGEVSPSKQVPPPSPEITPPLMDQPLTPDLTESDERTLKSCQRKLPTIMQNVKVVETQDIGGSISNVLDFVDPYQGSEKRVLIINLQSGIVNKISMQLGNPNTTYCLNIGSQIVNKIDIGLNRNARLIEARQVSIQNQTVTHPI